MSSPPKVFPEFFKVYLPELSWDRMQIPTAFVKHFNGFVPEKAILRDSVGRVWHVEGEEDVEEVERNEEEEEEEEPQSKSSNKGVVVFKRKYSGRGPRSIGGYKQTAIKKTRSAYKETSRTKSKYKKACTGNVEVDNALDFKSIVKPENPCFITKIRPGRRSKLYVPVDILKDHNIALPPRVLLCDPHGRSWPGDVTIWKDGRTWIGGWRAFCKWNHVGENDSCICEFVQESGCRGDLIVVHIHRVQPI